MANSVQELTLEKIIQNNGRERFWDLVRKDLDDQDVHYRDSDVSPSLEDSRPAFYLSTTHLTIDFAFMFGDPYVTVDLPYDVLRGVLKPEYLPQPSPPDSR